MESYEMKLKTIPLLLLPAALMLLVACGGGTAPPSIDIEATVEARVKERLAAIPTPTARVVEKEVVKEVIVEKVVEVPVEVVREVIVEKIVVVTATPTPTPEPLDGQVMVRYDYRVENPIYVGALEAWMEDQVLEDYANRITSALFLPEDLTLFLAECGEANAFYYPNVKEVEICVELIKYAMDVLAPFATDEAQVIAWGAGIFDYFMWHEIGHALIDIMDLPAVGRQEDAVDQLAALILIDSEGGLEAMDAVIGFFIVAGLQAEAMGQLAFWDEHSLDIQRAYDMACLMYGAEPIYAADYVELGFLPQERAQRCGEEYTRIYAAWATLLGPYYK